MKLWHENLEYTYTSLFKVEIFTLSILKSARWKKHKQKYVNVIPFNFQGTNNQLIQFLMEKIKEN